MKANRIATASQEADTPAGDGGRKQLLELIHRLYAGLLSDVPWRDFLRGIAGYLDSSYATLILARPGEDRPGEVVIPEISQSATDDYATRMFRVDPFVDLPEGEIVDYSAFVDGRAQSEEWKRFIEWSGAGNILGLDLRSHMGLQARFRITRNRNRPPFVEAEREKFAELIPLLRDAFQLHEKLLANAVEQDIYCGAIERLAVGTIRIDRQARIVQSNMIADRLIARGDGLIAHGGRLRLATSAAQRTLEQVLTGDAAPSVIRVPLRQAEPDQQLTITVQPIEDRNAQRLGEKSFALFIADASHHRPPDPETLQDIFQLTRMEAAIAAQLVGGGSLVEAANALKIAHSTARTHLRAVFAKTGVQRQSQLVRLIQSSLLELSGRNAGE